MNFCLLLYSYSWHCSLQDPLPPPISTKFSYIVYLDTRKSILFFFFTGYRSLFSFLVRPRRRLLLFDLVSSNVYKGCLILVQFNLNCLALLLLLVTTNFSYLDSNKRFLEFILYTGIHRTLENLRFWLNSH